MGPLSEARLFPDLSTCAFSAPRPSLRGYWFQERQKTSNFGAALPVPLGVPAPLRSRLSCSAEFTVEVCAIASSVSGLEPQNPTLRRDSFPKKIPWLPTQCWGLRRSRSESAAPWQKHHEGTEEGERCHGLCCEEAGDISGYVSFFWDLSSSYPVC